MSTLRVNELKRLNGSNLISQDDGLASDLAGKTKVVSSAGNTDRSVSERFADRINVLDFGAVGDGATDDGPALRLAAERLIQLGGGCIYFPGGKEYYLESRFSSSVSSVVFIEGVDNVHICGDGFSSKIRVGDDVAWHLFYMLNCSNVSITGLYMEGRDPASLGGGHRAINMEWCTDVIITECMMVGWGRYAISHQNGTAKRFIVDNCIFENIGNDCIDIKNKEAPSDPTELFVVSNIVCRSWGVTNANSPNVIVDARMPLCVNNVRGLDMRAGNRVVRIANDNCIVSNVFGQDDQSDGIPRTGTARTAVVNIQGYKNISISNVTSINCSFGVWPDGESSRISIVGGYIKGANRGVVGSSNQEKITVCGVIFEDCDVAFKTDAPYSNISGCIAGGCGRFIEVSDLTEHLVVVGNTISGSVTTAWTIPSGLLNKRLHSFVGNVTDIGGAGGSYLRDRSGVAFEANRSSESHTSHLVAETGVGRVDLSCHGEIDNIDIQIKPKGSGLVQFGSFAADASASITGYITIKDSAGGTRRVAVVE